MPPISISNLILSRPAAAETPAMSWPTVLSDARMPFDHLRCLPIGLPDDDGEKLFRSEAPILLKIGVHLTKKVILKEVIAQVKSHSSL